MLLDLSHTLKICSAQHSVWHRENAQKHLNETLTHRYPKIQNPPSDLRASQAPRMSPASTLTLNMFFPSVHHSSTHSILALVPSRLWQASSDSYFQTQCISVTSHPPWPLRSCDLSPLVETTLHPPPPFLPQVTCCLRSSCCLFLLCSSPPVLVFCDIPLCPSPSPWGCHLSAFNFNLYDFILPNQYL